MSYWTRMESDPPETLRRDGTAGAVVFAAMVGFAALGAFTFVLLRGWCA